MSLISIAQWNYNRNKLELHNELEEAMYAEEVNEFKEALKVYLSNPLTKLGCITDMVDGYCDATFVFYGTLGKQLGNCKLSDKVFELSIMNTYLTEVLLKHKVQMYVPDETPTIDKCMQFVLDANDKKPITKTKGKVKKGSDWVDPKVLIMELLLDRGFNEYPELIKDEEVKEVNAD